MAANLVVSPVFFVLALVLIAITVFLVLASVPRLLENTVLGVIALLVVNFLGTATGFSIPLDWISVLASAILGLAGVGLLIILNLLGIKT